MSRFKKIALLLGLVCLTAVTVCFASEGASDGRKIWDLVWRVINFLVLAGLLWWLLADKIKDFFGNRRTDIATTLEEVENAKAAAEKQFAEYEEKLRNVEQDIQEIKNMLIGEIEKEKSRIIEEGKVAADSIIEQARKAAEQEVLKARKELTDQVVDMAGDMAVELVSKSMNADDQGRLIEEYLDKVVK